MNCTCAAGLLACAAVLGLGEGLSTGLRELIQEDCDQTNELLGVATVLGSKTSDSSYGDGMSSAQMQRHQEETHTNTWTDAARVGNAVLVGGLGHSFGAAFLSLCTAGIGCMAVYFAAGVLPDTKIVATGDEAIDDDADDANDDAVHYQKRLRGGRSLWEDCRAGAAETTAAYSPLVQKPN